MSWRDIFLRIPRMRAMDVIGICALVAVSACAFGFADQHTEATQSLEALGGRVHRNGANQIYYVAINGKRIVDETLQQLSKVRTLESLSLSRSTLGSGQAKHLMHMNALRMLALYDTNISSFELGYIGMCRSLEVLSLDGTQIGESGLKPLAELGRLRYLSLARTPIGDRAVDALAKLTGLTELDIRGTELSPRAIRKLHDALPDCQITADPRDERSRRWFAFRRWQRQNRLSM